MNGRAVARPYGVGALGGVVGGIVGVNGITPIREDLIMAVLVITAASVQWTGGTGQKRVKAGETITPGQVLYRLATDGEYYLADADVAAEDEVAGVALTAGYNGNDMLIAVNGAELNIGATTVAGTGYVLSSSTAVGGAAGGISPVADLGAGDACRPLFVGTGTGAVKLVIDNNGAIKP